MISVKECMNNKELIGLISVGIAFPLDLSTPPRVCEYMPYSVEALLELPISSGITYEVIDRLASEGLVKLTNPYNGCCNVIKTYEGQRLFLGEDWDKGFWQKHYQREICCDKAIPAFCVCVVRTMCPDHGDNCHGSHD